MVKFMVFQFMTMKTSVMVVTDNLIPLLVLPIYSHRAPIIRFPIVAILMFTLIKTAKLLEQKMTGEKPHTYTYQIITEPQTRTKKEVAHLKLA